MGVGNRKITVIGHRANSGRVLLFYKLSKVRMIELDIREKNGRLYVQHGPSEIRRATIFGRIFSYIDYKFFYRDPFLKSETLDGFLSTLEDFDHILLDVKYDVNANKLLEILDRHKEKVFYISSSFHPLIKEIKELKPDIFTAASMHDLLVDPVKAVRDCYADAVSVNLGLVSEELVKKLHDEGVKVIVWTVNDVLRGLTLAKYGVDAIITDRPDLLIKRFKREGYYISDGLTRDGSQEIH